VASSGEVADFNELKLAEHVGEPLRPTQKQNIQYVLCLVCSFWDTVERGHAPYVDINGSFLANENTNKTSLVSGD